MTVELIAPSEKPKQLTSVIEKVAVGEPAPVIAPDQVDVQPLLSVTVKE